MAFDQLGPMIAAELRATAAATETLAEALCSDEQVAFACLPLLQEFDLLAQQQLELASLILRLAEGAERDKALALVRLSSLADRLRGAH